MTRSTMKLLTLMVLASGLFIGCATSGEKRAKKSSTTVEYACPVCDTGFITEAQWVEHVKKHHPNKEAVVARTAKKAGLQRGKVELGCPVCDTGFMSPEEWHDYVVTSPLGKKMRTPKVRVKKWVRSDTGSQTLYACPVCDTGFLTEAEWREHEAHHAKMKKKK